MSLSQFKFRLLVAYTAILLLTSCDDGNVIVSSFNFDENTPLSLCKQGDINVLHFIDSETNEAISFRFPDEDFQGTFTGLETEEIVEISLNSNNQVTYRKLSGSTNGVDYFCQEIPPSSPQVLEEFVSTTGGMAILEIRISEQDDDDGVPAELEDINGNGNLFDDDSDGDGIPDFLDTDDDNDNVLTASEKLESTEEDDIVVEINGTFYVDTDGDGIPNYLDDDDDGDGVPTKNEDLNACEDPENPALNPDNDLNADGIPLYLDDTATESEEINVVKRNNINRSFFTQVVFTDITFENQSTGESLSFTNFIMGRFQTSASQDLEFNDTVTSEDDVGNICQ